MINLSTKKLKQGMITAQSIYNSAGASYLTKGTRLNEKYIAQLEKIGVPALSVTALNPSLSLPPPDDIVQEKTRVTAIHRVFHTYEDVAENGRFDLDALQDISETILLDLIAKQSNLVQLTDIRLHDSYTFSHSVNVAILAAMLGNLCHYEKETLVTLTLGSLLHDIGKIIIPVDILNKPSSLNADELDLIRLHPTAGQKKLTELPLPHASLIAAIAGQHHEHLDGSGYPHHLSHDQIHRFARIVAITDVYDALTSDRPYKKAYKPHIAYKIMTGCSKGHFDEQLLRLFFDNVAIYPVGTILKTNRGHAIVKKVDFGLTCFPTVCIFTDEKQTLRDRPLIVNLAEDHTTSIENVINDQEIFSLVFRLGMDPAVYLTQEP